MQRFDAVARGEVECERLDAVPLRVEHGVGQREGLRHVVPGPGECRGVGVFEELFPEVFRTVDDELVVLEDAVVDFDREEDVALVGVADYDRNLAPLPGLDPGDLLAEFSGDTGVGEGAVECEVQGVFQCLRFEIGRPGFGFGEIQAGVAQRYGGLAGVGQHVGQFGRIFHRDLDVLQGADHLFGRGRLCLGDRKVARRTVDGVFPVRAGHRVFRADFHAVGAHLQFHRRLELLLQLGIGHFEYLRVGVVEDLHDKAVHVGSRGARPGCGACGLRLIRRVVGTDFGFVVDDRHREVADRQIAGHPGGLGVRILLVRGLFVYTAGCEECRNR